MQHAKRNRIWLSVLALTLILALVPLAQVSAQTDVFINEIHYDNSDADEGEAVEIAGPAGTDLAGWSIVLYNGNGGAVYGTIALGGVIPDQDSGYGTLAFYPATIQNGAPDGIALVDASGKVVWRRQREMVCAHVLHLCYANGVVLASGCTTREGRYWYHARPVEFHHSKRGFVWLFSAHYCGPG